MGLLEDARNIQRKDPAARTVLEVILLYPGFHILVYHRIAHWLFEHKHFFLARWVSQRGRHKTGIEIHPGAKIGKCLFIDHGMGIVFGETAEIGDNCTIYHGVTLGGTGKDTGKRHPTLGNNVLIGAGTKVLGPVYIGDNARIGAGSVVLKNLPANCTAVGVPAEVVRINNKAVNPADDLDQQDLPDVMAQRLHRPRPPHRPAGKSRAGRHPPHGPAGGRTPADITPDITKAEALPRESFRFLLYRISSLTFSTAAVTSWPMGWSGTPTTMLSQWLMGMSTRVASLWQTAAAIAGVISPSSESAMTMPMGPTMTSARRQLTTTAFSPVAARDAPARSMADGRKTVGAHSGQLRVRASGCEGCDQLTAQSAALSVNDQHPAQKSISSRRSSAMM